MTGRLHCNVEGIGKGRCGGGSTKGNTGAEQLRSDILATLGTAEVRGRAEQAGFDITPSTPQGVRDRIDADTALYAPLIAEGRIARM